MKANAGYTKKDVAVLLGCIVFVLANLGAIGSTGRRRAKEAVCLSNLKKWGVIWKAYVDDNSGYFADRYQMIYWPWAILMHEPSIHRGMFFCPEATKALDEGGCYPYAAWFYYDDGWRIDASYCANLWLANAYESKFWRTPYVANATYVPLMCDGNWKDTEPYETDEPFPTREEMVWWGWTPNTHEMRRVCIDRHGAYVNACFLDLSARRIGLKQLWRTQWHRQWDMEAPLPVWPEWMQNFEDPE